jgi:N-acetylmuramoyl-L-alanine amidase
MFETAGQLFIALQSKPPAYRTREDYTRAIEAYRAVYHAAPTSVRADPSAYAVAELTEEMGHRYQDTAVLQQAVKQYRFLLGHYPATKHHAEALLAIGNIEAENLNDRAAAREAYQDLITHFADTAPATEARAKVASLNTLAEAGMVRSPSGVVSQQPPAKDLPQMTAANGSAKSAARAANAPTTVAATQPAPVPTASSSGTAQKNETPSSVSQQRSSALIQGVRHWSTSEYTRVAIDVDRQVQYEVGEVPGPERIFFDLADTKTSTGPLTKTFEINDGLVRRIRVAPFRPGVARVVVELSAPADYTPFVLPNPWRIMVEVRPKHPVVNTTQQKPASPSIVAQPFTLSGGGEATLAHAKAQSPNADESMVVVVPMKIGSGPPTSAKEAPGSKMPAISKSRSSDIDTGASSSDAPAAKKTVAARKIISDDPMRPREAQPTSMGERSLTRALGLKIGRIVIDAGHGGHDTGAVGPSGYREKDLVLDVALRLGKLLEQKMGAEVIYTRDDDTFIPLEERTNIANHAGSDLFISIHANFSSDPEARGVETYYLNFSASDESLEVAARENATSQKTVHELQDLVQNIALKEKIDESREFAADVQRALWVGEVAKSPGIRNRGVKKAPFIVLIGAHMPSILAEISFVSNATDERRLRTGEYRQRIAESLYRGINRYASGLSGIKFAATSPKPSGTAVAATPVSSTH